MKMYPMVTNRHRKYLSDTLWLLASLKINDTSFC